MNWEQLFLADGTLRSIWRFFLGVSVVFAAYVYAAEVARRAATSIGGAQWGPWAVLLWALVATLAATLAGFKVLTFLFDRRPLRSMGLALGSAMILIVVVLEWGGGLARFTFAGRPAPRATLFTLVFLAVAAANEEIVFRGYPFQRLVESLTPAGAVAVSSVLFGVVHLSNPHHTLLSTVNTALVGVAFAVAYLRTRALWMPIAMHFTWNFLMGFVLGLPVSGIDFPTTLLQANAVGPVRLTGGDYGPEGGALATVAILAATVYLLVSRHISISKEMLVLALAPPPPRKHERPLSILDPDP
jgi:membrane protease YdiL (CAAX protease family)